MVVKKGGIEAAAEFYIEMFNAQAAAARRAQLAESTRPEGSRLTDEVGRVQVKLDQQSGFAVLSVGPSTSFVFTEVST